MKRKSLTIFCLTILLTIATYLVLRVLNGDIIESKFISCLLCLGLIAVPLFLGFLLGLIRKYFFHITIYALTIVTTAVFASELYKQWKYPTTETYSTQNYLVEKYFGRKAPFFTSFSTIMTYNEKLDTGGSDKGVVKCLYRIGDKKNPSSYYIAKVQLADNRIEKEYYNQQILQDKELYRKEFKSQLKSSLTVLDQFKEVSKPDNSR